MFLKIRAWFSGLPKVLRICVYTIVILVVLVVGFRIYNSYTTEQDPALIAYQEALKNPPVATDTDNTGDSDFSGTDDYLMSQQENYTERWGEAGDGFIWNTDGTKLALGDKSLSGEDVVYKYLQSLTKLDIENAEKFSRNASVVKRFKSLYDTTSTTTYEDQFSRGIYAESLKSIQIKNVESTSSLSSNKQVYTVEAVILDLTDKDFWMNDSKTIFTAMDTFKLDENDDTKCSMYLYEYILEYYKKSTAVRRTFTFDITVEKFSDLDTGWLVSGDADLDNACRYKDGRALVSYIKEKYSDYRDAIRFKS